MFVLTWIRYKGHKENPVITNLWENYQKFWYFIYLFFHNNEEKELFLVALQTTAFFFFFFFFFQKTVFLLGQVHSFQTLLISVQTDHCQRIDSRKLSFRMPQ